MTLFSSTPAFRVPSLYFNIRVNLICVCDEDTSDYLFFMSMLLFALHIVSKTVDLNEVG